MKKLIILIQVTALIFLMLSCKKESSSRPASEEPEYLGVYVSSIGDTTYVTENGNYAQLKLAAMGNHGFSITFDSVIVASDNTFTDNEWVVNNGKESCVGSGKFTSNTIEYHFTIGGIGRINQSAIKL